MKTLYKLTLLLVIFSLSSVSSLGTSIEFNGRKAATVGICVIDLSTGKMTETENVDMAMIPASILKSVTTATALSLIGPDFKFKTETVVEGDIIGNTLKGDLVIISSGDPTIESANFRQEGMLQNEIVNALKSKGISNVTGNIVVDESQFPDPGQLPQWVLEDCGWSYGAGVYGFNWMDNVFKLYPQSGNSVPEMPFLDIVTELTANSTDIIHGINSDLYIISGKDVDKPNFSISTPMNSPAQAFILSLTSKLEAAGICVGGDQPSEQPYQSVTTLATHVSPPLIEIMRSLMHRSDNMMAEATLRALSPGKPRASALRKVSEFWSSNGIDTGSIRIADGSGLARTDRVTPRFMAEMLSFMARSEQAELYVSLFPKAGKEGTVKSFLAKTRLDGKMALKSGSMNGVHCYAGYKLDDDGNPTHAVTIMVNNFFCSRDQLRRALQQWFLSSF